MAVGVLYTSASQNLRLLPTYFDLLRLSKKGYVFHELSRGNDEIDLEFNPSSGLKTYKIKSKVVLLSLNNFPVFWKNIRSSYYFNSNFREQYFFIVFKLFRDAKKSARKVDSN